MTTGNHPQPTEKKERKGKKTTHTNIIIIIITIITTHYLNCSKHRGVYYLRKIAPMPSTKIAFYIYYLLIISPGIHVMCITWFLQNYFKKII